MTQPPPGGPRDPGDQDPRDQDPRDQDPRDQDPGDQDRPDDVGSVAEEAVKLFGALSEWARDQGGDWAQGVSGLADHAATTARQVHDHLDENLRENVATGSPECRYCPVCRTIHVVREMSPEVRAHLTSAAASLVQAAAGIMATHAPDPGRQGVEHIDLDDGAEDDPEAWGDRPDGQDPGQDPGQHPGRTPEDDA